MDIVDAAQEALQHLRIGVLADELHQRRLDLRQIGLARQLAARGADHAALRRELAVAVAVVEARQQLAHGEVAGGAEDDEIEDGDGDDLCGHGGGFFRKVSTGARWAGRGWRRVGGW